MPFNSTEEPTARAPLARGGSAPKSLDAKETS